jgi:hypothetical protein
MYSNIANQPFTVYSRCCVPICTPRNIEQLWRPERRQISFSITLLHAGSSDQKNWAFSGDSEISGAH